MGDHKAILVQYLGIQRQVVIDKLDGLSEQQARTPITDTGTNALGVAKHVVSVEAGYLGDCFGRPFDMPMPWFDEEAPDNADMWATSEQTLTWLAQFAAKVWAHSDQTIAELDLDAPGTVPWWSPPDTTLMKVMVHVIAEYARHNGHLDIAREQVEGSVGWQLDAPVMPQRDDAWWADYSQQLTDLAQQAPTDPTRFAPR